MKKFRWILLSGLLVAATSTVQAQPSQGFDRGSSQGFDRGGSQDNASVGGAGGAVDAGGISNGGAGVGATTTTTTTTGISPDATGGFVSPDDAATGESSSFPDTGGEPLIAVLAGLSIAGAAVVMRRKVTA